MKKRILVCSFHQESNTFNPITWDIDRFGTNREFEGAARLEKSLNGKTAVHGGYTAITVKSIYALQIFFCRLP